MEAGTRTVDDHRIDISNVDRTYFPEAGFTKGDVLDHYEAVAELLLAHVGGRPFAFRRFPEGLAGPGFFQKSVPGHAPDWLPRVDVPLRGDATVKPHVVLSSAADVLWAADQGAIEFHPWLSRSEALEVPVEVVVDLDPPGDDPDAARWAARRVRDLLGELGAGCRLKTSGSKGYHVHLPLAGGAPFDQVRPVLRRFAEVLAARYPERLTAASRKAERRGRLYLDVARNAYGQTAVAPYGVRARPGAPVATPISWDELGSVDPRRYDLSAVRRRLAQRDDPWSEDDVRSVEIGQLGAALETLD